MPQNTDTNNALEALIILEKDTRAFGFDWPNQETIIEQARSECAEILDAIHQQEPSHRIQEEIGDLLHTAISLCLFSGYELEETIKNVVEKFGARMKALKELTEEEGFEDLNGKSFDFMLSLWNKAKKRAITK